MADALMFNDLSDPMEDGEAINRMEQVLIAIGLMVITREKAS
jgi:hypothetical protein